MYSKQQLSKSIGLTIKHKRIQKGISQEELADRAGLYRTYVGHIEVGKYTLSVYTLYKLCKALKLKSSDLLPF